MQIASPQRAEALLKYNAVVVQRALFRGYVCHIIGPTKNRLVQSLFHYAA